MSIMLRQALTTAMDVAAAIALPVALLALTISTIVVAAGWRRRRDLLIRQSRPFIGGAIQLGHDQFTSGVLDIAAETAAVIARFESLAAERFVALEVAVQPGLAVHADPRALREILGDLVACAIEQSPCGRVLLTAGRIGARVQIAVSDDGTESDRALRSSQLRPAERLAALQGAVLEVDARPGWGTTVALRLPAGATRRRPGTEAETLDPASVWARAQRAREGSSAER
jgi:hypothetical protein